MEYLLIAVLALPLIFLAVLLLLNENQNKAYHKIVWLSALIQLILSSIIFVASYNDANTGYFIFYRIPWFDLDLGQLGKLGVDFLVGVDGLSAPLLWLSSLVIFLAASYSSEIKKFRKGYFALFLVLSVTIPGCFVALDLFLFYVFFEFMLLPMFFLIGIWGGKRRDYASVKFFLYTLAGSIFILIVFIGVYTSTFDPYKTVQYFNENVTVGAVQKMVFMDQLPTADIYHSFDLTVISDNKNMLKGSILSLVGSTQIFGYPARLIAFLAIFIGFAVKLPAFPFHTWLPDAHVEAPTPISVILAGILLKIGGYGFIRIVYPLFPEGVIQFSWLIALIGVISIIYGALNALAMSDLKKLIAYSSVSHMGFVLLGIASLTAEGISGAIYQMFSHGLISATLFLIAGVVYNRTHDRSINAYSGLASKMPRYTIVVTVAFFASIGLPGFSGFIAELLVFLGAFDSYSVNELVPRWMPLVATIGLILGAAYYLWTLQRMFFGKFAVKDVSWSNLLTDLNKREQAIFYPMVILMFLFGIFSSFLLETINEFVASFSDHIYKTALENYKFLKF